MHACRIRNVIQDKGNLVRSFHLKSYPSEMPQEVQNQLYMDPVVTTSTLPLSVDEEVRFYQGHRLLNESIYANLVYVETLIIEHPNFLFNFHSKPHDFLVKSLKKLFIGSRSQLHTNLSGRNALWLLTFVPNLNEAALAMELTAQDFDFFLEMSENFDGYKGSGLSKVRKLALKVNFLPHQTNGIEFWDSREPNQIWRGDNKKTKAVSRFLRLCASNKLDNLEIITEGISVGSSRPTFLFANCLGALSRCFKSLIHLRLLGVTYYPDELHPPSFNCFTNFQNLRILATSGLALGSPTSGYPSFPPSLETFHLILPSMPYDEEVQLANILKTAWLPELKEVVVPIEPLTFDLKPVPNRLREIWDQKRSQFKKEEIFESGKVRLRRARVGEIGECG